MSKQGKIVTVIARDPDELMRESMAEGGLEPTNPEVNDLYVTCGSEPKDAHIPGPPPTFNSNITLRPNSLNIADDDWAAHARHMLRFFVALLCNAGLELSPGREVTSVEFFPDRNTPDRIDIYVNYDWPRDHRSDRWEGIGFMTDTLTLRRHKGE